MSNYPPQVGAPDTTGIGSGLVSEQIKDLTPEDIGYGAPNRPEENSAVRTPTVDASRMAARDMDEVADDAYTVVETDHMRVKVLTHGTGCEVTFPEGLPAGTQVEFLDGSEGGAHTFDASGNASFATVIGSGPLTMDGPGVGALCGEGDVWTVIGATAS